MRSEDEILATARDEPPFANGTEIFAWMESWCYRPCQNPVEKAWQRYVNGERKTPPKDYPGGCPLIRAAMLGKTPTEWLENDRESLGDQYHCIEFRGRDDGNGGEPQPRRDPPDMDGLFPRPERRVRLLKQGGPSTFYNTQCQLPAGHPGDNHYHFDTSHHRTTWQTAAQDPRPTP